MELFAGKTPAERNKIIAAIVLGLLALIALWMAFGPSFRGKASPVAAASPTPTLKPADTKDRGKFDTVPEQVENTVYSTTPVIYNGVPGGGPDAGRNIFAFYEPPPPTPFQPTPIKTPTPATPTPTPPILIAYVMPQNIYAGSGGFRIEVNGDKLPADAQIIFNQSQVPTTFVSPQKLVAEIPAALIGTEGPKGVTIQSPSNPSAYSNQVIFNVQSPPKPTFTYVGAIARKRYNNDTAYFQEQGKQLPTAARLNDVVGGRYRLVSISSEETVLQDVDLGFKYRLPIQKNGPGSSGPVGGGGGYPAGGYQQLYPNSGGNIPGFPGVTTVVDANGNPRVMPGPQRLPQAQPQPGATPRPAVLKKDGDQDTDPDDGDNNN